LQRAEGLRGLHHVAQGDFLGEKPLRLQQEGEDGGGLRHDEVEPQKAQRTPDDRPSIGDDLGKARAQQQAFDLFPGIKGNAFAVFAQPHQGIAVVGAKPLVQEVEQNQWAADADGKHGGHQHVQKHHEDHTARNVHPKKRERARQIPQNQRIRNRGDNGVHHAHGQRQRRLRKHRNVLLNALIRVFQRILQVLGAKVRLTVQPGAQQAFVQPLAPMDDEALLHVVIDEQADGVDGRQQGKQPHGKPEHHLVQVLQRGVHHVVPHGKQDIHAHREEGQEQNQRQPGQRLPARDEILAGQVPELAAPGGQAHEGQRRASKRDQRDDVRAQQPPGAVDQFRIPIHRVSGSCESGDNTVVGGNVPHHDCKENPT